MRLSIPMRDALERASRDPLRRVHDDKPGKPAWPANANTLSALVAHGLLTHDRRRNRKAFWFDEWTISDAGREALLPQPPRFRQDRPLYLAPSSATGDYTVDRRKSIDWDPGMGAVEVLRPASSWAEGSRLEHARCVDSGKQARQLGMLARAA